MKILHVITSLNTGGAEMMLAKLMAVSSAGKETHIVISLMDEGTLGERVKSNVKLYSLGLKAGNISPVALLKLYQIVKHEKPDVIQGWMYHANIAALLLNLIMRKTLVWNIRQSLVDIKLEKKLTRVLIKLSAICSHFVDKVIFNSYVSLEQHKNAGFITKNTIVIPNGFELGKYNQLTKEQILLFKSTHNITENSKIIGHVARFHPMKNHIGFVKNISTVLSERENVYCVMVGINIDSSNSELIATINAGGCAKQFILLGERSDLENIYGVFDFTVSSSLWGEAFPNVIGESMACGTPCIVSNVGDSKRIVDNLGFVYEPYDSDKLRSLINNVLSMTEERCLSLSSLCRSHINKKYAIESIYSQYICLYKELCGNSNIP